jgi:hypothetical protein
MSPRIRDHIRSNVVSYVALFFALGGSAAWAANTIASEDIINGEVKRPDISADAVDSPRVVNDSLRGADIDESTLGTVPVAQLGGMGRWESKSGEGCNVGGDFYTCAFTTIDLPRSTRVLMIGTAKVQMPPVYPGFATGQCRLATNLGDIADSITGFTVHTNDGEHISLVATTVAGPGPVDFAIRCRQSDGNIVVYDAAIAAVALAG